MAENETTKLKFREGSFIQKVYDLVILQGKTEQEAASILRASLEKVHYFNLAAKRKLDKGTAAVEIADEKQIGDYELFFKQGLSEEGDVCYLVYTANEALRVLLKKTIINDTMEFVFSTNEVDDAGIRIAKKVIRYKVKKAVFSGLYGNWKELLFLKEFIDKGTYSMNFGSTESIDRIKESIRDNLRTLIKTMSNMEVESSLTFRLK